MLDSRARRGRHAAARARAADAGADGWEGHAHSTQEHSEPADGTPAALARRRLRRLLTGVLVPVGLLTVAGLVLLWPRAALPSGQGLGAQGVLVRGTVVAVHDEPCSQGTAASSAPAPGTRCLAAAVRLTSGSHRGQTVVLPAQSSPAQPFPSRRDVVLAYDPGAPPEQAYSVADVQRDNGLLALGALFAVVVLALGRWTGLRALLGVGVSLLVVTGFALPALLTGHSPLLVALTGSAAVLLAVLFLSHGISVQTSIAVLGTLASLLLTVALAEAFVELCALSGLGSDEASLITTSVGRIDLRGLLLAGIVVGALGVLVDVTVTQASAVWELHLARPSASFRQLYAAGMRIGRDHIASTVNTLVLAYAGAALPLLVLYQVARTGLRDVVTSETVAEEIVRTLVGSVGLVAAVPVTTALAALTVRVDRAG